MRRSLLWCSLSLESSLMTKSGSMGEKASIKRWLTSSSSFKRCCRLLDAARGHNDDGDANISSCDGDDKKGKDRHRFHHHHRAKRRPLPVFPLQAKHFANNNYGQGSPKTTTGSKNNSNSSSSSSSSMTPNEFHRVLCDKIRAAQHRVLLASLYVGPAASPQTQPEEVELLEALRDVANRNNKGNSTSSSAEYQPKVQVRVVLDENRALRPVPLSSSSKDEKSKTTSSAKAVADALLCHSDQQSSSTTSTTDTSPPPSLVNGVYLFQVLSSSPILKSLLPNPLDEVAGVFHIKAYIVDDELIVSGANLSQEYFIDRQDRYLHLINGGGGLVDFYADLIDILCRHSSSKIVHQQQQHHGDDGDDIENMATTKSQDVDINKFLEAITNHFQEKQEATNSGGATSSGIPSATDLLVSSKTATSRNNDNCDDDDDDDDDVIAVAIPTFQAPEGFFDGKKENELGFVTDVEATMNLLHEAAASSAKNDTSDDGGQNLKSIVQLSSAYLNPTKDLISSLARFDSIEFLTAGRMSHGFKPKKKAGNKGKDWIPTVFDYLTAQMWDQLEQIRKTNTNVNRSSDKSLFHWEQPDWSFHAKGLWLRHSEINGIADDENTEQNLSAAIVGSSNFGERSFKRDMESNVILIFPPSTSPDGPNQGGNKSSNILQSSLDQEWNDMKASSREIEDPDKVVEEAPPLPWNVRLLLPFIKTFF
mmetsp:Transcript_641/g.1629  ORF Transcript_641/g.1629 Transcript_641/m.1629 type:complete len:706 (+) Transcript_641:83-2200(+)